MCGCCMFYIFIVYIWESKCICLCCTSYSHGMQKCPWCYLYFHCTFLQSYVWNITMCIVVESCELHSLIVLLYTSPECSTQIYTAHSQLSENNPYTLLLNWTPHNCQHSWSLTLSSPSHSLHNAGDQLYIEATTPIDSLHAYYPCYL